MCQFNGRVTTTELGQFDMQMSMSFMTAVFSKLLPNKVCQISTSKLQKYWTVILTVGSIIAPFWTTARHFA